MDVPVAVRRRQLLAMFAGFVKVPPLLHNLGAERPHRCHLHRVRTLGNADDGAYAKPPCRPGDRLAMIPGRRADDTDRALRVAQLRN